MTHLESTINTVKKFKATTPTNRRIKGRILHKLYHEEAVEKKQPRLFRVTSVSLIAVRKGRVKRLRQMFHVSKRG